MDIFHQNTVKRVLSSLQCDHSFGGSSWTWAALLIFPRNQVLLASVKQLLNCLTRREMITSTNTNKQRFATTGTKNSWIPLASTLEAKLTLLLCTVEMTWGTLQQNPQESSRGCWCDAPWMLCRAHPTLSLWFALSERALLLMSWTDASKRVNNWNSLGTELATPLF